MEKKNLCFTRYGKYNTKYKYCVDKNKIDKKFTIDENELIGKGSYGTVFGGKVLNSPIAVKLIPLESYVPTEDCGLKIDNGDCLKYSMKQFNQEVKTAKKSGLLGITPEVYYSEVLNLSDYEGPENKDALDPPENIGVIIFEKFGKSLEEWMKTDIDVFYQNENLIKKETEKLLENLFDYGFFNLDTHFGNILFDPETKKVKLLDLDLKDNVLSWNEIKSNFYDMFNFFKTLQLRRLGYLESEVFSSEEDEDED